MIKFRRKKIIISLTITLIFLFTVIMPVAGFAADNDYTRYSSTYTYVTADDEVAAGTATVRSDAYAGDGVTAIQIKLSLPDGVEFTNSPAAEGVAENGEFVTVTGATYQYIKSNSSSITLRVDPGNWNEYGGTSVNFDFSKFFSVCNN